MKAVQAALACCLASTVIGCSTDASATPATEPTPAEIPAVVSVEDVRALSGIADFQPNASGDRDAPQADPNAPSACIEIYNPPTIFSSNPLQFRSVVYDARIDHPVIPELAKTVQEVAVYSEPAAARSAFDRVRDAIPGCSAADIEFYNKPARQVDASTLVFAEGGASYVIRVDGPKLIRVSAVVPRDDERVAVEIADRLGTVPR